MILVDTSVWVDHLHQNDAALVHNLERNAVSTHPYIIGEIALGNLLQRTVIIEALQALPGAIVASHEEVLLLIETYALSGSGIGYIDAHLLASVKLQPGVLLWTRDKRLLEVAKRLGLAYQPEADPVGSRDG